MPLKIYYDDRNPLFPSMSHGYHDIYIYFEKQKWILTDDMSEADVVPAIRYESIDDNILSTLAQLKSLLKPTQVLMVLSLFHSDDWMSPSWYRDVGKYYFDVHPRTIFVHTNTVDDSLDPRFICLDIVFNRQKLYQTNTKLDPGLYKNRAWFRSCFPEMYELNTITEKPFDQNNKHVMCPNRILQCSSTGGRNYYKIQLTNLLLGLSDPAKYYLSDPDHGVFLEFNGWSEEFRDLTPDDDHYINWRRPGTWFPIADSYYNTSYASIFIESNVGCCPIDDGVVSPTEKFFDPLIKGHFPIGFSSFGTIKCLKERYGFRFPDWIDYSYDAIIDTELRFNAFLQSITNFLDIPLENLHGLYVKDLDILKHNQRIFFDRPYDSLHDKVQNAINQLEW